MTDLGEVLYAMYDEAWIEIDQTPWDLLAEEDKQKWRDIASKFGEYLHGF